MKTTEISSKHGEGIGGPIQETDDPNNPSYDPALHKTGTDAKIRELLSPANESKLSPWERRFVIEKYGQDRLPRKAHITVWKIHKRICRQGAAPGAAQKS